ncbi:hypothetical protein CDAR_20531 [Caerostris darwini]|uniref:Uncharacterized protein n=1 Tax=Caerostris darwini TaxID=1538125 RepID=A0AAV4QG86_9ARAC|nr:hypothetical protein CDAR_20531 [Caerostris darwini]
MPDPMWRNPHILNPHLCGFKTTEELCRSSHSSSWSTCSPKEILILSSDSTSTITAFFSNVELVVSTASLSPDHRKTLITRL